jgi:hypothetical protein
MIGGRISIGLKVRISLLINIHDLVLREFSRLFGVRFVEEAGVTRKPFKQPHGAQGRNPLSNQALG